MCIIHRVKLFYAAISMYIIPTCRSCTSKTEIGDRVL